MLQNHLTKDIINYSAIDFWKNGTNITHHHIIDNVANITTSDIIHTAFIDWAKRNNLELSETAVSYEVICDFIAFYINYLFGFNKNLEIKNYLEKIFKSKLLNHYSIII